MTNEQLQAQVNALSTQLNALAAQVHGLIAHQNAEDTSNAEAWKTYSRCMKLLADAHNSK
jgi:hypothetical protein